MKIGIRTVGSVILMVGLGFGGGLVAGKGKGTATPAPATTATTAPVEAKKSRILVVSKDLKTGSVLTADDLIFVIVDEKSVNNFNIVGTGETVGENNIIAKYVGKTLLVNLQTGQEVNESFFGSKDDILKAEKEEKTDIIFTNNELKKEDKKANIFVINDIRKGDMYDIALLMKNVDIKWKGDVAYTTVSGENAETLINNSGSLIAYPTSFNLDKQKKICVNSKCYIKRTAIKKDVGVIQTNNADEFIDYVGNQEVKNEKKSDIKQPEFKKPEEKVEGEKK